MTSRAEVTTKYAKAYAKASKKDKGRVLDQVVEVTGWSRETACRWLTAAKARLSHKAFLAEVLAAECDDREHRRRAGASTRPSSHGTSGWPSSMPPACPTCPRRP